MAKTIRGRLRRIVRKIRVWRHTRKTRHDLRKTLLFDFDGTIADTLSVGLKIVNGYSLRYGFRKISPQDVRVMKDMKGWAAIRYVGLSKVKFPILVKRVHQDLRRQLHKVKPFRGIPSVLAAARKRGYRIGIVTSNNKKNVELFLRQNRLSAFFDFIYTERSVFGKWRMVRKVVRTEKLEGAKVLYFGDEVRDAQAAEKNHLPFVGVTWGLNSRKALLAGSHGSLVESPREIIGLL